MQTYTTRAGAIRGAKRALGEDMITGEDFTVAQGADKLWTWGAEQGQPAPTVVDALAQVAQAVRTGRDDPEPPTAQDRKAAKKALAKAKDATMADELMAGITAPAKPAKGPSKREQARLAKIAAADKANKQPKAPKVRTPNTAKPQPGPTSKFALALAAVEKGQLPEPPVFTSATAIAKKVPERLAGIVALVEAGDIKGLEAHTVNAASKDNLVAAMGRYRDLAVIALKARAETV